MMLQKMREWGERRPRASLLPSSLFSLSCTCSQSHVHSHFNFLSRVVSRFYYSTLFSCDFFEISPTVLLLFLPWTIKLNQKRKSYIGFVWLSASEILIQPWNKVANSLCSYPSPVVEGSELTLMLTCLCYLYYYMISATVPAGQQTVKKERGLMDRCRNNWKEKLKKKPKTISIASHRGRKEQP